MNPLYKIFLFVSTIPARLKGAHIGQDSFLSPGYDIFGVNLQQLTLGNHVLIGRQACIGSYHGQGKINIGEGTNIGRNLHLQSAKSITIGKKCLLSYHVSLTDHDHLLTDPNISPMDGEITPAKPIAIGNDCFIGAHSFILKGVTLGRHCVVGANSVVTQSFPDFSVIAGNPAKLVKTLK